MKEVKPEHGPTFTSEALKTQELGISQDREDQLMIMNVLTNTLYTRKAEACLREYGCNAADANVEAGAKDRPFDVQLPSVSEPTLVIRDYGLGMSDDQIVQTFAKLGRSTKRQSNEFTGMLGIGSKAGFAYGDLFTVSSFVKGEKTIYNFYRDKGLPTYAQMHKEKTKEPGGIEVRLPVKVTDIAEFTRAAERVYRYFKVRPKITGADVKFVDTTAHMKGTGWRYTGNGQSVAVMGNIGYDIPSASLGTVHPRYTTLLRLGVELDFDLGDLQIAANREGLQYMDHTRKKIIERLDVVISEIGKVFTDKVTTAKSLWEAKSMYGSVFEKLGSSDHGMRTLREVVSGKVKWRGKDVSTGQFEIGNIEQVTGVTITEIERGYSNQLYRRTDARQTYAADTTALIINDLGTGKSSPNRERGFFHANPNMKKAVVFYFPTDKVQKAHWKARGLEGAPTIPLSSIKPLASATTTSGPSAHRKKHSAKAFVFNEKAVAGSYGNRTPRSGYWAIEDVDLEDGEGVYVMLDAFELYNSTHTASDHPETFKPKLAAMRSLGLFKGKLYGFKAKAMPKLGKKWVTLQVHLADEADKNVKKTGQLLADYIAAAGYSHLFDSKWADLFPSKSLARAWLEAQHKMLNPAGANHDLYKNFHHNSLQPWLVLPKLPAPSVDLKAEEQKVMARYPIFPRLDQTRKLYYPHTRLQQETREAMQDYANYVRLVDKL